MSRAGGRARGGSDRRDASGAVTRNGAPDGADGRAPDAADGATARRILGHRVLHIVVSHLAAGLDVTIRLLLTDRLQLRVRIEYATLPAPARGDAEHPRHP